MGSDEYGYRTQFCQFGEQFLAVIHTGIIGLIIPEPRPCIVKRAQFFAEINIYSHAIAFRLAEAGEPWQYHQNQNLRKALHLSGGFISVSYTHLTLPTKR